MSQKIYLTLVEESSFGDYFFLIHFPFFFKFQFIGVRRIFGLKLIFAGPAALLKTILPLFSSWKLCFLSLVSQSSTPHKNKCKARNEKCVHILQHFQTLKKKPTEVNLQWQNGGVSQSFLWPCSKREFVLCKVSNPN